MSTADLYSLFVARLTGRNDISVRYSTAPYARMVSELGVKFNAGGWPEDIPFNDLNRIKGGVRPLRRLLTLVEKGTLKLVPATEEDRQNAHHDPESVIPNHVDHGSPLATSGAPPKELIYPITHFASQFVLPQTPRPLPTGTVLHPITMSPHFSFSTLPTTTADAVNASGMSAGPRHRRAQRSDINKSRFRPVTNPQGRKLRHPKRGPMTARHVVEASGIKPGEVGRAIEDGNILLTDENLGDCYELTSEGRVSGEREMCAEGELSSDIESAGEWDREMEM